MKLIKPIKKDETDEFVKLCSQMVETLKVDIEYRFNDPKFDEEWSNEYYEWENLKVSSNSPVHFRTKKIKVENWEKEKWEFELIDGIKNLSSTWEECQNLVLDFYKTKTKIIVSFEKDAGECFHSNNFSALLKHNADAYIRFLESNPDTNLNSTTTTATAIATASTTAASTDTTASVDTTASPDITDKTETVSVSPYVYTSSVFGVVSIVLLGLTIYFIVKSRKENIPEEEESNELYGQYYGKKEASALTDRNVYY